MSLSNTCQEGQVCQGGQGARWIPDGSQGSHLEGIRHLDGSQGPTDLSSGHLSPTPHGLPTTRSQRPDARNDAKKNKKDKEYKKTMTRTKLLYSPIAASIADVRDTKYWLSTSYLNQFLSGAKLNFSIQNNSNMVLNATVRCPLIIFANLRISGN